MFPADANTAADRPLLPDVDPKAFPLGDPKGIRYHATRLEQIAKESSRSEKSSSGGSSRGGSSRGGSSPTRSRVNAAISGTPCKFLHSLS